VTLAGRANTRLAIGRVVAHTFQTIRENLGPLSALSIIVAIPVAMLRYQAPSFPEGGILANASYPSALAFYAICSSVLIAVISKTMLADGDGRHRGFAKSLSESLKDLFLLAVIGIVSFAVVLVGLP
jgi:hypothetical protein